MEEELEKILSIIRKPKSRALNLSKLLTQSEVDSSDIAAISTEIRLKGKKFESIALDGVDLSELSDIDFLALCKIIALCLPSRLYLNNVNLKNLSIDSICILANNIIPLGVKVLDISNNDLYDFEQEKFAKLCRIFRELRGLSAVYIAGSSFMYTAEENQIEFWGSITASTSIKEVYIWQEDRMIFSARVRDAILNYMENNFIITFVGLYPFQNDGEFMDIVLGYSSRNIDLEEWVSNNIILGNFLLPSPIVDTEEHAKNTVIDWAVLLNFDGKQLYTWHNSLYKMFVKVANSISACRSEEEILRKTQQYAVNNWAKTKEGKNLVSRSFEMNLSSIKKELKAPVRLYSYDRHSRVDEVLPEEPESRIRQVVLSSTP